MDLEILGNLDLALISPLLEARGMRAAGRLDVNATVGGSMAAPQISGSITLAKGSLRDYARGVNLSDISADSRRQRRQRCRSKASRPPPLRAR